MIEVNINNWLPPSIVLGLPVWRCFELFWLTALGALGYGMVLVDDLADHHRRLFGAEGGAAVDPPGRWVWAPRRCKPSPIMSCPWRCPVF